MNAIPHGVDDSTAPRLDLSLWSMVLLKPDAVARRLVGPILDMLAEHVAITAVREVRPTEAQIFDHYADILIPEAVASIGVDVAAELHRLYVGQPVVIALAQGADAAPRLRTLIGPTDPADCPAGTVRGRWADDTLLDARAERRLINNVIHTSDPGAVLADVDRWYGRSARHLLFIPSPSKGA